MSVTRVPTSQRVPSGAVQFGDDWPGLFIRGDEVSEIARSLRYLQRQIHEDYVCKWALPSQLQWIVDTVATDVMVRER